MKLIALRFQGVGPYKGEYAIDFAALTRSHMFLIDGETGAGKTTLLDCVTFALYGSISGNTEGKSGVGDRNRLRSRFLDGQDVETYVELIFEEGGHYYAVRRTPAYEKPKARGEGMTSKNATGKMMRVADGAETGFAMLVAQAGEGDATDIGGTANVGGSNGAARYFDFLDEPDHAVAITSRAGEVAVEVERLLGLDRGQFSKTIMLAQGQFAQFLRMSPEDRTDLVKELFGAEEYEAIQNELDARRKRFGSAVDEQRATLEEHVRTARENAQRIMERLESDAAEPDRQQDDSEAASFRTEPTGAEISDTDSEESDAAGVHDEAWRWGLDKSGTLDEPARSETEIVEQLETTLRDVESNARRLLSQTESRVGQADERLAAARRRNEAACGLRESYEDMQDARTRVDELESRRRDIETVRQQVAQARQAAPIVAKHAESAALRAKLDDCLSQIADNADALADFEPKEELRKRHAEAVAAAAGGEAARKALQIADAHARTLAQAKEARECLEAARHKADRCKKAMLQAAAACEALPSSESVEAQLEELAGRLGARGQREAELERAKGVLVHARTAETLAGQVTDAEAEYAAAQQARSSAEADADHAEETLRLAGAARYAEDLVEGAACPVCGSVEHPHPASRPDGALDEKTVKALRKLATERMEDESNAKSKLETLRVKAEAERAQADGADVASAEERMRLARHAMDELDELAERQTALKARQKRIADAVEASAKAGEALTTAIAEREIAAKQAADADSAAKDITAESIAGERGAAERQLKQAHERALEAETLTRRISEREELEQKDVSLKATREALTEQHQTVQRAVARLLEDSDFADYEAAETAALDDAEIMRLESQVDTFGKNRAAADADMSRTRELLTERLDACRRLFAPASGEPLDSRKPSETREPLDSQVPQGALAPQGCRDSLNSQDRKDSRDSQNPQDWNAISRQAAQLLESIDFAALDAAQSAASQSRDDAISAQQTARDLDTNRREIAKRLTKAAETWRTGMADFAPVRTMALLATAGKDSPSAQKVSLVTFAVTERFRDVLDRANELLKDIHGGVYELRLGTHEGRSGGKTGLPIAVFDRRTERSTEPSTLSGGETFFVSLALALALADVIQAENGGISMETLFIDEGFGSLSDEYLDDVMDVLDGIARTRDIGIISHVGQLKERVHARVSVARVSENGESRLTVTA